MKRVRSKICCRTESMVSDGLLLEKQPAQDPHDPLPSPPPSPEELIRPAKIRKHGSKLVSALRSLTNSTSSASMAEPVSTLQAAHSGRKFSLAIFKGQLEPTVVHRTQFKSRPSVISIDKGIIELAPEASSPSTSAESSSNSGKSSTPRPGDSTGKTSLDSKFSIKSKIVSQHSSENKKVASRQKQITGEVGSNENPLTPIAEVENLEPAVPVPTIVTVEWASAAKVFFECYYNGQTSGEVTARSMRRRQLEGVLSNEPNLSSVEKYERRRAWIQDESDYLRETRIMKARAGNVMKGKETISSKYDVVKVLGKGSFGVVRLVREKSDNESSQEPVKKKQIYAMKVIRKSDMLRNSQEGHLRAERDFLVAAEGSRWVVPLISSFQDLNNLYLVMDYMPGGDFLGLLIRDNVLSEPVTKWYIAEMILCIEEAHALRWIHRDVKPDNFLISASGHLKISDFGLAFDGHWSHDQAYFNNHRYSLLTKLGINIEGDTIDKKEARTVAATMKFANVVMAGRERHEIPSLNNTETDCILNWRNRYGNRTLARSVVGTSQYMAPEVVRGELYDARCDWWSVAVILYECLYGHTPFLAEEGGRQQTKANILDHKITFGFPHKPVVSKRCQDLIRSIIQEKDNRLCSKRYKMKDLQSSCAQNRDIAGHYVYPNDAEDIKAHKWFRDIQWDKLHTMVPPFVPNIKSMDDTHYFDEEDPISDFSESVSGSPPTVEEISDALKPFNREIQIIAKGFIERPHDSLRLKKVEREIDAFVMPDEQKEYLKAFVKQYGQKERKRPRDKLLRDKETAPRVLELRKKGAFMGYTYRRFKPAKHTTGKAGSSTPMSVAGIATGKRTVWHRARLSIH